MAKHRFPLELIVFATGFIADRLDKNVVVYGAGVGLGDITEDYDGESVAIYELKITRDLV